MFFDNVKLSNIKFRNVKFKYFEFYQAIIISNLSFENVDFIDERIGTELNIGDFENEQIIEGEEALKYFVSKSTFKNCTFANKELERLVVQKMRGTQKP